VGGYRGVIRIEECVAMDHEAITLSQQIADKLRPRYRELQDHPDAFGVLYREAVKLVAQARHMTEAKTQFFSRDVLQRIMNLVMP
jgi:hypothetical protein